MSIRVKDIALSVKCLPYQRENLSSEPQHLCEKLGVVTCICNSTTGHAETGGSLEWNDIYPVTSWKFGEKL